MATKINVDINVSDNGTAKKSTEAAERLKKTYDAAAKSASKIGGSPTMAGASSRATSSAELVEYNRNRALATGTGASARDFAKQAEGLGGLVRLYATFAANVFAVSAAFGALSSAMDTTNMIRGLDQLGASSGVALGALSKRLVETTGGAVSLREAMEATVKASAAGIDSSSILRLGKVAQQASVALGVNAADALNRLSRGVVKLEPELLDELGIFTKIDPAVKKYAESVNKAVSELTDFERRQAFLNAVIEEGEQKFSQIEIDTNPYTKLSAALQNTLQNALELINKGLGPIANFLAESPSALTAALVALGSVLVRQALPALGQVRAGLAAAAEEAAETAGQRAQQALAARQKADQIILDQVELQIEKEVAAVTDGEKRLGKLRESGYNRRTAFGRLLSKDVNELEEKDFQRAESRVQTLLKSKKAADQEEAALGRQIIDSTRGQIKLTEDLASAKEKAQIKAEQDAKNNTILGLNQRAAIKAETQAKRDALVSNAAYNASLNGISGAMTVFKAETQKSGLALGFLSSATLTARAALASLAGALGTVLGALNGVFLVITVLTTAWALLSGFFTTKELGAFSNALDGLESTTDNLVKTFQRVKEVNPFGEESFKAQSNALMEFSNGLTDLSLSADKAIKSLQTSKLASATDAVFSFFGGGTIVNFQESLAANIASAVSEIDNPTVKKQLQESLKKALNIEGSNDILGFEDLLKIFRDEVNKDVFVPGSAAVKKLSEAFKEAGIQAGILASRIEEVKTANKEATSAANALKDSYKIKNPIIEFAEKGIAALDKLSKALQGKPEEFAEALEDTFKTLGTVPLFGKNGAGTFPLQADSIKKQTEALKKQAIIINNLRNSNNEAIGSFTTENARELSRLAATQNIDIARIQATNEAADRQGVRRSPAVLEAEQERLDEREKAIAKLQAKKEEEINKMFANAPTQAILKAGTEAQAGIAQGMTFFVGLISKELNAELSKNKNKFLEGMLGQIDFIPGLAEKQVDLKIQELDAQKTQLESQKNLFVALTTLEATIAEQTAQEKVRTEPTDPNKAALTRAQATSTNLAKVLQDPGSLATIQNPTPELARAATQAAAFVARGQEQNQTGQLLGLDKVLAKEKDKLNLKLKSFELDKTGSEITDKALETARLSGTISEENYLNSVKDTKQTLIDLDNTKKLAEIESKKNSDIIKAEALKGEADQISAVARIKEQADQETAKANAEKELQTKKLQLDTELKLIDIQFKRVQNAYTILDLENQIAQVKSEREVSFEERSLELDIRRSEITRSELIARKQFAAINKAEVDLQKKVQDRTSSYVSTQIKLSQDLAKAKASNNQEEVSSLEKQIELQYTSFGIDLGRIREDSRLDSANKFLDIEEQRLNLLDKENSTTREIQDVRTQGVREEQQYNIGIQENRLESLKQIGAVEESRYLLLKNSLEIAKLEFDFENRKKDAITSTLRAIEDSQRRVSGGTLTEEQIALEQNLQEALAFRLGITISKLSAEKTIRQDILAIVGDIAVKDAKRAEDAKKLTDQYKEMADVAKLIGDVFDNFGDRFAETVGGLSSVLQTDLEKRAELEKKYQQKQRQAADKYRGYELESAQALAALNKEKKEEELKLDMELTTKAIGNTKGLFKEKSTAFKTLTALEKASAAVTLALNAKVMADNLLALPTNIANGVGRLFSQLGVGGFAASAAFLALMGSLGVFKGSAKGSFGPSLQQVQDAQTTGQSYQNGVLTTNRGALSADPTKTLESIDESLELLKTYGFDELEFSNKNSTVLDKIENNTKGLAEAIAIQTLNMAENLPQTFQKEGASLGTIGGALGAGALGTLLFGPIGALGALFAKPFNKILGSIFGGKTTQTVKDFGVIVSGSLSTLIDANTALVQTFTDLETFRKGGWFKSDKLSVARTPLERASEEVVEYVSVLFGDVKNTFLNSAEILGRDVTSVVDNYVIEPFEISTKDLKPEEIVDVIKNKVSLTFNALAEQGFGSLVSALRDPLEEAGTTLTRLSSQVTLFDQAMSLVGKSVGNITNTLKVVVADDLIELVGGVETFQEKISFFRENFLSEAEQIAPIAEALRKELEALGVSGTLSKDQFKALVLSQDLATDSGRTTFAALLNVAEAFDTVASAAEEAQSKLDGFLKDIRDFIREQTLDLVQPSQSTRVLFQEFGETVSKSLQGDENSLSYLPDIASQTIESARNSSTSLREFNKLRAGIIGSLSEVASKIESGDLKILTPQEQSNVLLEQIVDNTGNLAQDLAKEIDRQAAIREIVSSPEAVADALALSVAQAIQESSYEFSLDPKTVAFLEEERRQQDIADELGVPEKGPLSIRMGAVDQLLGAVTPGGSITKIADAIQTGDMSKLAPDLSKVTLSNLGIKAPSLDEFIYSVSQASNTVELGATFLAAQAINAIDAVKNTVNSLIDAVTGNSGSSGGSETPSWSPGGISFSDITAFGGDTLTPNALGGAFNKGIKMFETGGAFTNSVISNPTMFPLGVMGEAGPEAIMPLTRTSDGSLGVEATVPLNATMNRFNAALLQEVKELRKEIEKVRVATEVSATGTNKTFRLLDRVTENGDALNVVVVTA